MKNKDRITLYLQILLVSIMIPSSTFFLYNVWGNDFNISIMLGIIGAILMSMTILTLRSE
ncbi:hypothetical protein ACFLYT_01600 [Nanoarchaeota archaeon]